MKFVSVVAACFLSATLMQAQGVCRFDFGSAVAADGYTAVSAATLYSDALGFGFEPGYTPTEVVRRKGDALTRDFVTSQEPFRFSVKLPEGNYKVTLTLGDPEGTSCTTVKSEIRRLMVESCATAKGEIKTVDASIAGEFGRVMAWADKYRTLKVRTNADTPRDAKKARELGAEGIGLCRTEHMFFEEDRIAAFREMICSDTVEEREEALEKILPYQQNDFKQLYEALEGCPVTIRFLDPPLHEFVPTTEDEIKKLADAKNKSVDEIKAIINSLHEFNPMMGHRGCRLAVTYPEIAKMQTKAVIRAALEVQKAHSDWNVKPEIMIPLVCEVKELKYVKQVVVETADAEIAAAGAKLEYEVGTMIEIPRAALTADEIAKEADFFCFGTNDLTQMTFGFSRDDAGKFLNAYYDTKIFENDPFAKLDQTGVGKLMEMSLKLGKPVNPKLHVGICGEHGGDPSSVEFCHKIGLDYVSCSPFRVPVARLAAAQAAIAEKAAKKCDKCDGASEGKKSFVDDETKAKLEEVAKKAEEVAKELAEQSADVAKAGFEGLKAGVDAAIKAYKENRNK